MCHGIYSTETTHTEMHITSQSKTKRRKWPWIVAAVFVFFYLVGGNERENVEPVTSQTPLLRAR